MDQKTPGQAISEALRNLTQPFLDIHVHKRFSLEEILEDDEFFEDEEELVQDEEVYEEDEEVVAVFPPLLSPPQRESDCHGVFRACERKREKSYEGERVTSENDHREGSIEIQRRERESLISFFLVHPKPIQSVFSEKEAN